jgi:hypothetical protein
MGSNSDAEIMQNAADVLDDFDIDYQFLPYLPTAPLKRPGNLGYLPRSRALK